MTKYSNDLKKNAAYLLLSTMSPDQVRNIINLCATEGASILPTLAEGTGAPKVLGLLSEEFVHPDDFPHVLLGLTTMYFAAYRDNDNDFDFYERILTKGTMMPAHLASKMAANIETRDLITSRRADGTKVNDIKKAYLKIAEKFRRAVNWFVQPLGWENDQAQDFDLDRLYEIKLLGQAIDEASSYGRLIASQEKITGAIGAGAFGDVVDNPVDAAELDIVTALAPELGAPVPIKLFGMLKNLVAKMREANAANIGRVMEASGEKPGKSNADPAYQAAAQRLKAESPDSIAACAPANATTSELGDVVRNKQHRASAGLDGAADMISNHFGEEAGLAYATGDVAEFMRVVSDLADSDYVTTGDPHLDEEIVAQTLAEIGDVYEDYEELGGLFKKARVKANLKKAARITRRANRKKAKQVKRNAAQNALARSRRAVRNAQYRDDDYTQGLQQEEIFDDFAPEEEYDETSAYQEPQQQQSFEVADQDDYGWEHIE